MNDNKQIKWPGNAVIWIVMFFNRKYGNKPEARLIAIDPDHFRILASPKTLFQTGQTANIGMKLLF
jgi:hypothetical protein